MAFARLAFRVLLILLVLFAVVGLLLPSSTTVERSIVIDAPPAAHTGDRHRLAHRPDVVRLADHRCRLLAGDAERPEP